MILNLMVILLFSTCLFASLWLTYKCISKRVFNFPTLIAYLLTVVFGSVMISGITVVDQTEHGIILRGGKITRDATSGFNFTIPFVEKVVKISTQSETTKFEKLHAYTSDPQRADVFVSLTYRIDPSNVPKLYTQFKTVDNLMDRVIRRNITSVMGEVFGKFTARDTVGKREELSKAYSDKLIQTLEKFPIEIISIQIENVTFSPEYNAMIEESMKADVRIKTTESEYEIVVIEAKKQKELADAKAYAIEAEGKAEANKIKTINSVLNDSPRYIEYLKVVKWDGAQSKVVLSDKSVPLISVDSK